MTDKVANFVATRLFYDVRNGAPEARLSTTQPEDCYLSFQRRPAPGGDGACGEDERIYLEFNAPDQGGYDLVQECYLDRDGLTLRLDRPLSGKSEVRVALEVEDAAFERFLEGMRQVFADKYHLLHLAGGRP